MYAPHGVVQRTLTVRVALPVSSRCRKWMCMPLAQTPRVLPPLLLLLLLLLLMLRPLLPVRVAMIPLPCSRRQVSRARAIRLSSVRSLDVGWNACVCVRVCIASRRRLGGCSATVAEMLRARGAALSGDADRHVDVVLALGVKETEDNVAVLDTLRDHVRLIRKSCVRRPPCVPTELMPPPGFLLFLAGTCAS